MSRCDGGCIYPGDILTPADLPGFTGWHEPAYPDPACSLHGITEDDGYPPMTPEEEEEVQQDITAP